MILATDTTSITLPDDLLWTDEFAWSPVQQSTGYTLAGSLVVEEGVKLAGRPITLMGGDAAAWVSRATIVALKSLEAQPGLAMTLTLPDSRQFSVMFSIGSGSAIETTQVVEFSSPNNADYHTLTLRLMEV